MFVVFLPWSQQFNCFVSCFVNFKLYIQFSNSRVVYLISDNCYLRRLHQSTFKFLFELNSCTIVFILYIYTIQNSHQYIQLIRKYFLFPVDFINFCIYCSFLSTAHQNYFWNFSVLGFFKSSDRQWNFIFNFIGTNEV